MVNIMWRAVTAIENREIPEWMSWALTIFLVPVFITVLGIVFLITSVLLRYFAGFSSEDILSMNLIPSLV